MKKTIITTTLFLAIGLTAALANDNRSTRDNAAGANVSNDSGHSKERNILSSQLPPALLKDVKQDYKNYWISELFEEGSAKHPSYYITLENADQTVKLSSDDSKNWIVTSTVLKGS
jgi:hypothetical protein